MKLVDTVTATEYPLPALHWVDEFNWNPAVSDNEWTLTGSLVIEPSLRLSGRPITLQCPQPDMGWITREQLIALRAASTVLGRKYTLHLEYANDSRTFTVVFDHQNGNHIEASPVKGFPHVESGEWFTVVIRLIEAPA